MKLVHSKQMTVVRNKAINLVILSSFNDPVTGNKVAKP